MNLGDGADGRNTYAEGAARLASARSLLIGVTQDMLIPPGEMAGLAATVNAAAAATGGGGPPPATYVEMDSRYGHDAFLKEPEALGALVRGHLEDGLAHALEAERDHNTGSSGP